MANRYNEEELLEYAIPATASQVEAYSRGLRNAKRRISTDDVNRIHRSRYMSCYHHSDGSATVSAELTQEAADLVMKAIGIATAEQQRNGISDDQDSLFARQADALVAVAQTRDAFVDQDYVREPTPIYERSMSDGVASVLRSTTAPPSMSNP